MPNAITIVTEIYFIYLPIYSNYHRHPGTMSSVVTIVTDIYGIFTYHAHYPRHFGTMSSAITIVTELYLTYLPTTLTILDTLEQCQIQ